MANSFAKNPIVLDTAHGLTAANTQAATNDARYGGAKFSSLMVKIKKIIFKGANGDVLLLKQVKEPTQINFEQVRDSSGNKLFTLAGEAIADITLETGNLSREIDFGEGQWFKGLCPETISAGAKAYIHLA